ncbi:MAG: tetratricopeptide repeat protein [Luteolibacter sp.]
MAWLFSFHGSLRAEGSATASELLRDGERCYQSGQWEQAADCFSRFLADYSGLEEAKPMVAKVTPLLAMSHAKSGRFQEAAPWLAKALADPLLDPKMKPDLLFFSGVVQVRCNQPAKARDDLAKVYADTGLDAGRRMEALVLGGMTYVMEKDWKGVDAFFSKHLETIRSHNPETATRAELMWLHALMREDRWEEAATKAETLADRAELRQVVSFAVLLIDLGNHFFANGEIYRALKTWRIVPTKKEMERRLQEWGGRVQAAEYEKEQALLASQPQFDHAVRLRMAQAYFQLGRTREACLLLDQMLRQMDADPTMEAATASLIRGWMSLERWVRAGRTAELYLKRCASLADRPNEAEVRFLRAEAIAGQFRDEEAADAFREVAELFKGKPIAARAEFMEAYQVLQQEQYARAKSQFEGQLKVLAADDEMRAHVLFWRAMADYFDRKWQPAREELQRCLKEYPQGEYADDCHFRLAYIDFSEARYPQAIEALRDFIGRFPASEWLAEAQLALGDSQAAEGLPDDADQTYASIPAEASGFHDEAWMKRGNLKKLGRDFEGMKRIYQSFLDERGDSPRLAEALHWLGWIARQEGKLDQARETYWKTIETYGDDRARPGLEDVFVALKGLYPGQEAGIWKKRMQEERAAAKDAGKSRLAVRIGWALAQGDAEQREVLVSLFPEIVPKETDPRILADVADALAENHPDDAKAMYEGLRKWWPRAPERDRAFVGLGFLSLKLGDNENALRYFDQFEKYSVLPKSAEDEQGVVLVEGDLGGKVALARAGLMKPRKPADALNLLLAVQKNRTMPAKIRAEAFLETGRIHVTAHDFRQSLPYFEQVYLLFNRYPDFVTAAYLERGAALEVLREPQKAREVYSELAQREDLKNSEASKIAREKAEALGGLVPLVTGR